MPRRRGARRGADDQGRGDPSRENEEVRGKLPRGIRSSVSSLTDGASGDEEGGGLRVDDLRGHGFLLDGAGRGARIAREPSRISL